MSYGPLRVKSLTAPTKRTRISDSALIPTTLKCLTLLWIDISLPQSESIGHGQLSDIGLNPV